MKKKLLNICLVILFSDFIFAQDLLIAELTDVDIENKEEINQRTESKIEILEEKFDLCKDYFDRINSTYQWSMGIIFTVIIAFLGITGYNYHRILFFDYQFKAEPSEKQKLSLSLKVLNILSASNWGYSDWLFSKYFKYIEDCCSRKIYFNYSEVDDVKEMLAKLPERFENEKNKLISVIDYDR